MRGYFSPCTSFPIGGSPRDPLSSDLPCAHLKGSFGRLSSLKRTERPLHHHHGSDLGGPPNHGKLLLKLASRSKHNNSLRTLVQFHAGTASNGLSLFLGKARYSGGDVVTGHLKGQFKTKLTVRAVKLKARLPILCCKGPIKRLGLTYIGGGKSWRAVYRRSFEYS
jgi:hypothetical protein